MQNFKVYCNTIVFHLVQVCEEIFNGVISSKVWTKNENDINADFLYKSLHDYTRLRESFGCGCFWNKTKGYRLEGRSFQISEVLGRK